MAQTLPRSVSDSQTADQIRRRGLRSKANRDRKSHDISLSIRDEIQAIGKGKQGNTQSDHEGEVPMQDGILQHHG